MTNRPDVEAYDWHAEPEGVLKWLIPTLLADVDQVTREDLDRCTESWRRVELRVLVNDVELPARALLEGLVSSFDYELDRLTAERLRQVTWLETLQLHVEALESALAKHVRDAARELNLPLHLLEED